MTDRAHLKALLEAAKHSSTIPSERFIQLPDSVLAALLAELEQGEARHRALVEAGDGAVKWLERNGAFTCSTGINGDFCSCGGCGLTSAFKAFRALLSGEG